MLIGLLSDAHGNIGAFDLGIKTLREAGAERIIFLGDAIGYIPDPSVVSKLRREGIDCLLGNHEAYLLAGDMPIEKDDVYRLNETRLKMDVEMFQFMRTWPDKINLKINDLFCCFVHGSPIDPLFGYVYPDTPLEPMLGFDADLIFMGATHRPFLRKIENKKFINIGSIGLPRDSSGFGSVVLFDTLTQDVQFLQVDISNSSRKVLDLYELHPSVAKYLYNTIK